MTTAQSMVVGCQSYAPAAFNPFNSFSLGAESTPGPWFGRKNPVTTGESIPRPSDQQCSALTTTLRYVVLIRICYRNTPLFSTAGRSEWGSSVRQDCSHSIRRRTCENEPRIALTKAAIKETALHQLTGVKLTEKKRRVRWNFDAFLAYFCMALKHEHFRKVTNTLKVLTHVLDKD